MRTKEEIDREIAMLEAVMPHVMNSAFGDDNEAAIRAQIIVLKRNMVDSSIFDIWGNDYHVCEHALYARGWLDEDPYTPTLAEDWAKLTNKGDISAYYPNPEL